MAATSLPVPHHTWSKKSLVIFWILFANLNPIYAQMSVCVWGWIQPHREAYQPILQACETYQQPPIMNQWPRPLGSGGFFFFNAKVIWSAHQSPKHFVLCQHPSESRVSGGGHIDVLHNLCFRVSKSPEDRFLSKIRLDLEICIHSAFWGHLWVSIQTQFRVKIKDHKGT